jgi:radical SAM-linked protein
MSEIKFLYRAVFSKNGDMRFIGHLDLQQLFERALRRSALPLRYSQGFSPKVRLNLAGALPLGFTSTAEMMDFWLEQPVEPPLIQEQLNAALPTGIRIISVTEVPNDLPSLQASLKSAEYEVSFKAEIDVSAVNANLEDLLNKPNLIVTRRNKQVDLKPLVEALHWEEDKLYLRLSSSPEASARPDELLALLDLTPEQYDIQRIGLYYS